MFLILLIKVIFAYLIVKLSSFVFFRDTYLAIYTGLFILMRIKSFIRNRLKNDLWIFVSR